MATNHHEFWIKEEMTERIFSLSMHQEGPHKNLCKYKQREKQIFSLSMHREGPPKNLCKYK